ncbi:hypothetical protein [Actinophytocola sp.]|uniref:hypothetical protein n=1 Tax=Actinophytocola sp. TaxID=1872138 RepID=UPI002ED60330
MKVITGLELSAAVVLGAFYVEGGLRGDWLNDWLTGLVVLLLIMWFSFRGVFRAVFGGVPKEFRDAPIGIGTVTGVTRTGLVVNDQPQLDIRLQVDTSDGRSFSAVARQVVDLTDLPAVQPDAILPVRYLPDNRVVLATDAPTHELQAALDRVHVAKGWLTPKQLHITEHGIDASAVVLGMTPTGHTSDGRSELRLGLRVTRPDGTTFDVTQDKKLPPTAIPQVQPGMVVRVKYLPYDESDVAVLTTLSP